MISSGDFDIQNFQSLIENYEAVLKDVTGDLESVQAEQKTIRKALNQNNQFSSDLRKILSERANYEIAHTYSESDLTKNLKLQLKLVNEEKEQVIKLWQNCTFTIEQLEQEVRIYQENMQGFIPKAQLIELQKSYEEKLNDLQATVTRTKTKLEETINMKSKELQIKDKEITGTLQSHDNTFKIIQNLEEEVLKLQQRLNDANSSKVKLQRDVILKNEEIDSLKIKVKDCRAKVEEALQVVEAALNEKDAALLREANAKDETTQLSQTLNDFIDETDGRIKRIKQDYETKLEQMRQSFQSNQQLLKAKETEIENYMRKNSSLEMEVEKFRNSSTCADVNATSKMLVLEKNLENTFQKLLLSEKQNIQLKSEMESIKNDLEQMSHLYQRDINSRDTENGILKNEIKSLKHELDASHLKVSQSMDTINGLNKKISTMEINFNEQIEKSRNSFQQSNNERKELEAIHKQIVIELQDQLLSQTEINKKWRSETKNMTEQLEKIISELKLANNRIKQDNKSLHERLKEANMKMFEYRKFLEMISEDVSKITNITLPEINECTR